MHYIPSTEEERQKMLEALGYSSSEELFKGIPEEVRFREKGFAHLPPEGLSEFEVLEKLEKLATKNGHYKTVFRGGGAYKHYIPSVVRHLANRSEFVTAYTPYQPELSQGILQGIFEFQTIIAMLTGMEAANASVYDGATAAAEGVAMCVDKKRQRVLLSDTINPETKRVIQTYCRAVDVEVVCVPAKGGETDYEILKESLDDQTGCVYTEQPNFFGVLEDPRRIAEITHSRKAKYVLGVNPISLNILKTPFELGADVAVGEGQPLGIPLGYGGPYLGFMAARKDMMRKLPGRIAGETKDLEGNRAYVLTLQAREQHIRREKACSSICSNQALCALTATIYTAAMGKEGLKEVALRSMGNAQYACGEITKIPGFEQVYRKPFFHEFVTTSPIPPGQIMDKLREQGILGGLPLEGDQILWCTTEANSKEEIDQLTTILRSLTP